MSLKFTTYQNENYPKVRKNYHKPIISKPLILFSFMTKPNRKKPSIRTEDWKPPLLKEKKTKLSPIKSSKKPDSISIKFNYSKNHPKRPLPTNLKTKLSIKTNNKDPETSQ